MKWITNFKLGMNYLQCRHNKFKWPKKHFSFSGKKFRIILEPKCHLELILQDLLIRTTLECPNAVFVVRGDHIKNWN